MAREAYIDYRPRAETRALIDKANAILDDMGIRMTVRQLYYQLVAADVIPNSDRSYQRVVKHVGEARLGGLIDWDHIEDRLRQPRTPATWSSVKAIARAARDQFCLDHWEGQARRVEIWLEKDALAGICGDVAREWQVTLQVNRGYSSHSAMHAAASRILDYNERGIAVIIGYLGDHDPSGDDMVRDVGDRLRLFGAQCRVVKLAIMAEDIETYSLPPQPVKSSDSRAGAFRAAHGDDCVELDALRPDVLTERIEAFIDERIEPDAWDLRVFEEERQRATLDPERIQAERRPPKEGA